MDDMDRALFEAFSEVWPRLLKDPDELRARLARRRSSEMSRSPRAWCMAVRASDRRIEPYQTAAIIQYFRDREVEREEVRLDAAVVRSGCARVEVLWAGGRVRAWWRTMGVRPEW